MRASAGNDTEVEKWKPAQCRPASLNCPVSPGREAERGQPEQHERAAVGLRQGRRDVDRDRRPGAREAAVAGEGQAGCEGGPYKLDTDWRWVMSSPVNEFNPLREWPASAMCRLERGIQSSLADLRNPLLEYRILHYNLLEHLLRLAVVRRAEPIC